MNVLVSWLGLVVSYDVVHVG